MEKIARYRTILAQIIQQEAQHHRPMPDVEVCQICDDERQHYQLLYVGWQAGKRVFAPVIHLRIHNGKIWIEHDGTEEGVANTLIALGVEHDEIVLAFYSPRKRTHTEFAVA